MDTLLKVRHRFPETRNRRRVYSVSMRCDIRFICRIQVCILLFSALSLASLSVAEPAPPRTLDPELQITLFASEPEIVTPIGIAADGQSRIFVVESHTHEVKPDYPGPKHDRVKI